MTTIARVPVEFIRGLRHDVLRPNLPIETACFQGDELATTWHVGLYEGILTDKLMSCCSFFLSSHGNKPAWQLRGMATRAKYQGKGYGKEMLGVAEKAIREDSSINMFWCNARLSAIPFYEKMGWEITGPEFDMPGVGAHREMSKVLKI